MKLRLYLLFVLLLFCKAPGNTQVNLVPNPSFEIYDTCPYNNFNPQFNGADAICRAVPWFQPNGPHIYCGGSSDFFHECNASVPNNCVGFQYAKIGYGYAGAGWGNPDVPFGEYLEVQLIQLMKQKKYCTSFYVNTPSVDLSSTNCIQARFTEDTVYQNQDWSLLNLTGGIDANEIVRDTSN